MTLSYVNDAPIMALIYCRVSSVKQTVEGSGLQSQEHRCLAHAQGRGYLVERTFLENVSGGLDIAERPAMKGLLAYLESQKKTGKPYVVIFDDHKRFARHTETHLWLRRRLESYGAKVEYLNFSIEDTPEGVFFDTMLAAQAQLEREQLSRQTKEKTKARLEKGFWTFRAPIGYRYVKSKAGGKELIKDEPIASIVTEALEGFASGRFATQAEVKRFLEDQPAYPKDLPDGSLRTESVARLMQKPLYAGYLEAPKYGVSLRKAQHEPLISLEIFETIQQRRQNNSYLPARKDIHLDFPLRGAVCCASCGKPLRASWTKGNTKLHPYYLCQTKGCADYGKSIRRDQIEGDFADVLKDLQPATRFIDLATAMFKDAWEVQAEITRQAADSFKKDVEKLEQDINTLLGRIVMTSHPEVIEAYEHKIAELKKTKLILEEKAAKYAQPKQRFDEMLELSLGFLANPYKLWTQGSFPLKRTVLKLTFQGPLYYTRNPAARTPFKTKPHKAFTPFYDTALQFGATKKA